MLASETAIVFPGLLLLEDDYYWREVFSLKDLDNVGWELVDSAGQRFVIRAFIAEPLPFERGTPLWKRWLFPRSRPHRFDAELEPLPPETFEETFCRIREKDAAHEAYWLFEGGGPDTLEMRARFRRCQSIADVIAYMNTRPPGAPTELGSILEDLKGLWLRIIGRASNKR